MPHQFFLQRVYNETFSATWSTNNQPLLFSLICLTHSACTQLFSVFFCFSTYIHVQMLLSQQVNVSLHYLSLGLMNSPSLTKSLEYYTSQSVNTSWVANIIRLCNLIDSLHASFNSSVSARLPFCHCIKQQTLIFPPYPCESN